MNTLRVAALLLVVWFAAPLAAAAESDELTIGFYNVLNLFDVYDDPYTEDEGTQVKPRSDVKLVAAAIRQLDADILGLCEVENEPIVRAMVEQFLPDAGYEYIAVQPSNSDRGIKLGLISRLPITSVVSYRWQNLQLEGDERQWRFARDLFHAKVQVTDDKTLDVFVVHLKSKSSRDGDPQSVGWRTSEATRIQQIIGNMVADDPDRLIALIGDFNSNPDQPATRKLLEPGTYLFGNPVLIDVFADQTVEQRITYPSERYPNTIFDYILVSPALAKRLVPGSATVMSKSKLTRGSDHLPVIATFDLGD